MHLFLLTVDSDLFWFSTGASLFCFACEWIYMQAYRGSPDTVETRPSSEECKQKVWTDESSAVVLSPWGRYKPNVNWCRCFKISTKWMLPGCTRFTPSICMFNDAELNQADRILWSADLSHDPLCPASSGNLFLQPLLVGFDINSMLCKLLSGNKYIESEPGAKSASMLVKLYSANVANDCEQ